jgi:hypothetical protein
MQPLHILVQFVIFIFQLQVAQGALGWNDLCVFTTPYPSCIIFASNPSPYNNIEFFLNNTAICGSRCTLTLSGGQCASNCTNYPPSSGTFEIANRITITGPNTQILGTGSTLNLKSFTTYPIFLIQAENVALNKIVFGPNSNPAPPPTYMTSPVIYQVGGTVTLTSLTTPQETTTPIVIFTGYSNLDLTIVDMEHQNSYTVIIGPSFILNSIDCDPTNNQPRILFAGTNNIANISKSNCTLLDMASDLALGTSLNMSTCNPPPPTPAIKDSACEKKANQTLYITVSTLSGILIILIAVLFEYAHKAALQTRGGIASHTQQKIQTHVD